MSRCEDYIKREIGTKNWLFRRCVDSRHLYMFMKWRQFKIGTEAVKGIEGSSGSGKI
jgi:hypothetical protein